MDITLPTSRSTLESRALGCLAGLAVGNVLGLAVESHSRDAARRRLGASGPLTQLPLEEKNKDWDDDLAMAMALSEALVLQPRDAPELDAQSIRATYLAWLKTGARGIGGLTHEVLTWMATGETQAAELVWQNRCDRGARPLGNGAAMRIAPLGLAFAGDPSRIAILAAQEAALTHWDPACRQTAAAIALLTAALIRGERDPIAFARSHAGPMEPEVAEAWDPISLEALARRGLDGGDMGSTLLALKVAVSVLKEGSSYADAMPWIIRQGGDTDTNGAILGALLGSRDGLAAIPVDWRRCVPEGDRILRAGWKLLRWSGLDSSQVIP